MKKKRALSFLLAVCMVIPMLTVSGVAAGTATEAYKPEAIETHYFYDQLNDRAKAIYTKLLTEFKKGEQYYDGTKVIDLMGVKYGSDAADGKAGSDIITNEDIENYRKGNKEIFNDFCAAKDALDLDHSELWWIDSGYLTFRVTSKNAEPDSDLTEGYHVLIGPGRGDTYLLGGKQIDGVKEKDTQVNDKIKEIVDTAVKAFNDNPKSNEMSDQDRTAFLVSHVHDQITKGIHYRYEIECSNPDYAKYIRTIYGIITHEGVCEAYARTLQVALTQLGIECVLIHGVQTKGTPEDHMWNAVNIPEGEEDHWYVVDATWDDPLVANYDGTQDLSPKGGLDGRETNTYLLVGQSLVGEYWKPSGRVSTGNGFEFGYPTIEMDAYSGAAVYGSGNDGLVVKYTAGSTTEDSTAAGAFTITYNGQNAAGAMKNGVYFLLKMYDYHPDGTADVMQDWYYTAAVENLAFGNPYIGDREDGFRLSTSTCEYVEIAVTTRKPDHFDQWSSNPFESYLSLNPEAGFFHGDESEIIAQSGMLYNINSGYEAPPYVKTQTPAPNGNATAGVQYRFKVTYDDLLYHILPNDQNAASGIQTADAYEDNYEQARKQTVQVRYITDQQDLHDNYAVKLHQVVGELPFDMDRDGVVDMEGEYTDFKWIYASDPEEVGGRGMKCPNSAYHDSEHKDCNVEEGCPIVGVEFNFRASDQWIDDVTQYTFVMEGLVGSRSNKYPNNFSVIAIVPGLCPACYRSQGIDWNLWGQPTLLDAPENLDLEAMAREGGTDQATIDKLNEEMNRDDLNGRLMLVVEDKSKGVGNREEYEEINDALPQSEKDAIKSSSEVFSSIFEINFNRICPMVKLKPNKGQSLRVQVGYPAGITYETLEGYDLKAFHFTRCSNDGEQYWCEEFKQEYEKLTSDYDKKELIATHNWGEHIVSTEEIKLIPTPYGIVIMCDAFSPFEIVAVKKDPASPAAVAAETKYNVIVVSGDNGYVEYTKDGKTFKAVGADGNLEFGSEDSVTFTVKPAEGYVVDTVSLGGEEIKVDGDKFTVSDVQKSDVLNVTFLPEKVKTEEEQTYGSTVVAEVCQHPTEKLQTTKEAKEATCTTPGNTKELTCTECGQVVKVSAVIPATGHQHTTVTVGKEAKAATCTAAGSTAEITCNDCHETISKQSNIQPLGHVFTVYVDTDEKTCQGTKAVAKCDHAGCEATDTKYQTWGALEHDFVTKVEAESKDATCTEDAVLTLKCQWCDETTTQVQKGTATGHLHVENGVCKDCGTYLCGNDNHKWEVIEKVDPTCTENGQEAGRRCTVCGLEEPGKVIVPLGHDFGGKHTAGTKCSRCEQTLQKDQHTEVPMDTVPATCDTEGTTGGTKCSECGDILTPPTPVEPLGHDWNTENAVWHWSTEGGKVTASVTLTCTRDTNHKETFEAQVTVNNVKMPTCTQDGEDICTATVEIGGKTFTDNNGGKVLTIPAKGHEWDREKPVSTTDATCISHATKTYKCKNCDATDVVTDTESGFADHKLNPATVKLIAATCTEPGKETGTCSVCGQEITIKDATDAPALGHDYDESSLTWTWTEDHAATATVTCKRDGCGHENTLTADVTESVTKAADCETAGERTYTAKVTVNGKEYTNAKTAEIPALGHDYDVDNITWTWAEDHTATATVTCKRDGCGHENTLTADVTESVTKAADCETAGERTYTAKVTVNGKEYTNAKTAEIPALGHDYDADSLTWTWTEDHAATATVTCKRDGCGHENTLTADVTESVTKAADCDEAGERTYTAKVTVNDTEYTDTDTAVIPALGHDFGPYSIVTAATCTEAGLQRSTCSRCGAAVTRSIPALGHNFVDGVCTRCGQPEHEQPERPKHPVVNTYTGFTDVPAGEWYEEELKFAYERNLILGTDFDKFSPEENLTRVQWMILLARFDFQDAGWSANVDADSMAWAVAKGITDGSDPDGAITREQMVTMLWRYFGCPTVEADLSGYTDAGDISDYAVEAFKWAFSEHIIGGVSATELAPQDLAQRSEAAAIFARFVKNIEGE